MTRAITDTASAAISAHTVNRNIRSMRAMTPSCTKYGTAACSFIADSRVRLGSVRIFFVYNPLVLFHREDRRVYLHPQGLNVDVEALRL